MLWRISAKATRPPPNLMRACVRTLRNDPPARRSARARYLASYRGTVDRCTTAEVATSPTAAPANPAGTVSRRARPVMTTSANPGLPESGTAGVAHQLSDPSRTSSDGTQPSPVGSDTNICTGSRRASGAHARPSGHAALARRSLRPGLDEGGDRQRPRSRMPLSFGHQTPRQDRDASLRDRASSSLDPKSGDLVWGWLSGTRPRCAPSPQSVRIACASNSKPLVLCGRNPLAFIGK